MSRANTLVLFDIDGTLLRGAGHHHKQALIDGIREVTGATTHLDGIATSGMLDRDLIAIMLKTAGYRDWHIRRGMRRILEECQNSYCANCASDMRQFVCPGVPELLSKIRDRGAAMGLVTGNLSRIAWRKMELAGLREYFSVGAFAEDGTTRARLARVAANRAISEGLVIRHARISLIGDHPNDIEAARANGFRSVAVGTGLVSLEDLKASAPHRLVETLRDLDVESLF